MFRRWKIILVIFIFCMHPKGFPQEPTSKPQTFSTESEISLEEALYNSLKEKIQELKERIISLEEDNKKLTETLVILKKKFRSSDVRERAFKEKILNLKRIIKNQKDIFKSKETVIEELQRKIDSLKEENQDLKKKNGILAQEKEALKEELGEIYLELGKIYTQAKLFKKAIKSYENSLKYNPLLPQGWYFLGLLYEYVNGDDQKSIFCLKKYLELTPQGEKSEKAKELIEILSHR